MGGFKPPDIYVYAFQLNNVGLKMNIFNIRLAFSFLTRFLEHFILLHVMTNKILFRIIQYSL